MAHALMAHTESSSVFTFVIRYKGRLSPWAQLGDDEYLSQLHQVLAE